MIKLTAYQGNKTGVFGLGKAGKAAVKSLLAGGAEVYAWDDREDARNHVKATAVSEPESWPWDELEVLVLSPGIPLTHPEPHPVVSMAQLSQVPIVGEVELLWQACPKAIYLGVTGTNGKSTTTALIGHILRVSGVKQQTGGNLGTPALELEPLIQNQVYVLELSSYQLDLMHEAHMNIAILLNITADHLDRHGDMKGYVAAKKRIFRHQGEKDVAIIGVDGAYESDLFAAIEEQKKIPVTVRGAEVQGGVGVLEGKLTSTLDGEREKIDLTEIATLQGVHNGQNAAAAFAACRVLGLSAEQIARGMQSFQGLPHRMELVAEIDGVRFINDSKATNLEAAARSLACFDTIYWLAGGQPKEETLAPLARFFPKIRHAFLFGEAEEAFARSLEGRVPFRGCDTMQSAFQRAAEMALRDKREGAVVLLAPACASFDQWQNFEERGDAFRAMTLALKKKMAGAA